MLLERAKHWSTEIGHGLMVGKGRRAGGLTSYLSDKSVSTADFRAAAAPVKVHCLCKSTES